VGGGKRKSFCVVTHSFTEKGRKGKGLWGFDSRKST